MKKYLLLFAHAVLATLLLPSPASAAYYKDAETNILYWFFINDSGKGEAQVCQSGGVKGDITILDRFKQNNVEYTVTGIQEQAFHFNRDITSVILPNTIKEISDQAFMNCSGLQSVVLSSVLTNIGKEAFSTCPKLESITLPGSLRSIGEKAFFNDGNLKEVKSYIEEPFDMPEDVFLINTSDGYMFNFATLYVPAGTKEKYLAIASWNGFRTIEEMSADNPTPEPLTLHDGDMFTASVGNGMELRFTVISEAKKTCMLGITETLEDEYYPTAFADGSAGKNIGMASQLVAIEIPEKVNGYKVIEIAPKALAYSQLTGIKIPSSVTKIGDDAFWGTWIASLRIPASVKEIGETILVSQNLRQIVVDEENPVYDSRNNCNAIIETATNTLILGFEGTTIVEGIETIGKQAFPWCWGDAGLFEIHIPKTVKHIVDNPFSYNQATVRITVAEDNPVYDSRDNCNAIIHTATGELVAGCKNTVIPDGVTRIGRQAFSCLAKTMESLTLPETILSIGNQAFYKTSVKVVLPPNLQVIEDYAFRQNMAIEEIVIPATVTSIGIDAFFMCNNLKKVTSMIMEPMPLGEHAFDVLGYTWTDATLYVPFGTKEKYEATEGWKYFKTIIEMEDEGIDGLLLASGQVVDVYTPAGVLVYKAATTLENLPKGVYIVGGKKVVVK